MKTILVTGAGGFLGREDIVKPEGMNCSKFYSDTHWLPKYNLKDMIRYQIESDFMERNRCD